MFKDSVNKKMFAIDRQGQYLFDFGIAEKEIAKSLDIDPEQLVNDPEKAAIFMKMMGEMNGSQQTQGIDQQQGGMANTGGVPAGAANTDTQGSGGGNIGVGTPQVAGEGGFTAPNNEPQGAA